VLVGQVVEVSTSKTGKHGHAKCHFVAIDIFTGKKLEDIVPSSHNCDVCMRVLFGFGFVLFIRPLMLIMWLQQVPHVNRIDYQLIDISEDGFVRFQLHLCPLFIPLFF